MKKAFLPLKKAVLPALLTLLLCMAGVTNALAQNFTVGDLNYSINSDGVSVTVTGFAEGADDTGELVIPDAITQWGSTYPVTAIGGGAFQDRSITSVIIGNSVTYIGYDAFYYCYYLTSVTIGNSVTNIDEFAFFGCNFTSLIIPESVTYIGYAALGYCYNLTTLNYNAINCSINSGWFYSGSSLTNLTIGDNVQVIPNNFVSGRSSIVGELVIPASVTHIGSNAFNGCSGLTGALTIPASVTSIGESAFANCTGFTGKLNLPSSITTIEGSTFANCSGFTGSLTIPASVVSIGGSAFANCSGFTGPLTIPASVTSIGELAFSYCTGFSGALTFGMSLTQIGNSAFFGACENFTSFNLLPETPPNLGENVFISVNYDIPVSVPCGSLSAYQEASGWSQFSNIQETNPCMWEVTATANPAEGGTVSGGGTYEQGQTCTVTATPLGEYEFGNWTENGVVVSTDAEYTFTVESSRNLVANFTNPNFIIFADPNVEARCVELWDTDGDGHLSYDEAAAVTDLNWAFEYWRSITSFNELQYFTGLTFLHEYEFYDCRNMASVIIPESVTSIGYYAFESCYNLTSITIPEAVTSISYGVFAGSGLTTLNYNATNCSVNWDWLYNCNSLTHLTIGDNVQVIPEGFMYGRSNLVGELVIPNSVTSIGNSAFENCSGFTGTLTLPASLTSIGGSAFANCSGFTGTLTLPATLTSIEGSTFNGCSGFTGSLIIPDNVTSIGGSAFANCSGFTTLTIGSGLVWIDYSNEWDALHYTESAFYGCTGIITLNYNAINANHLYCADDSWSGCGVESVFCNLTSLTTVNISENVQSIPTAAFKRTNVNTVYFNATNCNSMGGYLGCFSAAFAECEFLTTLNFGSNVQTIPNNAFQDCSSLTGTLTLPASVTSIGESAFANCTGFSGSLTIPNAVTSIGGSAFANCSGFNGTLTLPATLTSIEGSTFNGCSGFTGSLTIPDNVTSIGGSAFANCSGFNGTLTLPATLTSIEGSAFNGCSGFTGSLTIPDNVTYIGSSAFKNCSGFTTLTIGSGLVWIDYSSEWDAPYYTESAFYGCTGFTTLNYNAINCPRLLCYDESWNYMSVFSNCTSLVTLNIGEDVQSLPTAAFSGTSFTTINFNAINCVSNFYNWGTTPFFRNSPYLTTLNIGENVQTIPERAFKDCGFVGNLVLPESLTTVSHYAFCNCSGFTGNLTIPESVTSIGGSAFANCTGFTGTLTLPASLTSIESSAFNGCSGFTGNLLIPNSVSYIGSQAFYGCTGMEETLTIGHLVLEIGYSAFNNTALTTLNYEANQCNSIGGYEGENASVFYNFTTVNFGDNVESIPNGAFRGCSNLVGNLVLPNSLAHIGDQAFYNCYGFEGIVMGNSVETIGSEAFRNCGGLHGELTLPETLLTVGNYAFASCDEISTITYNAINCTEMGNAQSPVFYDCASIAHLNIGENVLSIPNYAFKRCSTVVDMRVGAVTPPVIASSTFGTVSRSIPVSVPYGSGDAYRSAQYWEEFFNITEDYSPNPFTYHWNVNVHQFAGNMTVTGIIQIEGVEQAVPHLEIGAFCNGECRGRQLLTYYPQVDRYLVFLMLYGEDGDVFNFRLFDHSAGQELTAGCTSVIAFETDATIGSFSNPYVFNFTNVQVSEFTEGWSWWSTYIEQNGIDGLSLLENGLGTYGLVIKSQSDGYTEYYDDYDLWYGSLNAINNESSYMVKTSVPCTVTMPGTTALPSQHPITVDANGWTWIGYPVAYDMDINVALDGLASLEGDVLKSQEGYAEFYEGYGWFGSMASFLSGRGYMYKSTSASPATFTYPSGSRGDATNANLSANDNHWVPAVSAYPFNMTVTAVVELDGEELRSDRYELAAFANGESRGSVRLMYVEPIDRHVAFLTIAGEEAADLSFSLYDTETGLEYFPAEENIVFEANATLGRLAEPFVVSFRGTTGMDELANSLRVYPNPVNAGERFSICMNAESKAPVRVEIVNALGAVVSVETSTQAPASIVAPATAGVYTLRVTVDGKGTAVRKLVVK